MPTTIQPDSGFPRVPIEERLELLLHLDRFVHWLQTFNQGEVGVAASQQACPLAHYLSDHGLSLEVGQNELLDFDAEGMPFSCAPLPHWACTFVERVDLLPNPCGNGDGIRSVTAPECLTILERIQEDQRR